MSPHEEVASQGLLHAGICLPEVLGWERVSGMEGVMTSCQWHAAVWSGMNTDLLALRRYFSLFIFFSPIISSNKAEIAFQIEGE